MKKQLFIGLGLMFLTASGVATSFATSCCGERPVKKETVCPPGCCACNQEEAAKYHMLVNICDGCPFPNMEEVGVQHYLLKEADAEAECRFGPRFVPVLKTSVQTNGQIDIYPDERYFKDVSGVEFIWHYNPRAVNCAEKSDGTLTCFLKNPNIKSEIKAQFFLPTGETYFSKKVNLRLKDHEPDWACRGGKC